METMKAAIYKGIKKIEIMEKPIPRAGSNDIVVQIKRAGICATDTTAYLHNGDIVGIYPGAEFGHEMVGVVSETGEKVTALKKGTRVFVNPMTYRPANVKERGGAFSEYVLVENAQLDYNVFILPDELSFDDAVIIEPFSVGIHGKNVVGTDNYNNVVIFGAGAIGLSALSGLIGSGNKKPVVVDIDDKRLKLAEEMGGIGFNSATGDLCQFLTERFGQSMNYLGSAVPDIDVYMDCAGAPNIPEQFLNLSKIGSRFVVVAVYKKPVEVTLGNLMWTESSMMGSFMYNSSDIREAIDYLSDKNTNAVKMITHNFSHSQIVEAFEMAINTEKAVKVVINYELA
ncbi:Galactitol-1-phosphate 5-dehydrogenase [Clostridium sp. C105KSO15]|nr:Galactitol-1-phosphate 5-dehydrogenase [Clostridium sp. C105KSO15]